MANTVSTYTPLRVVGEKSSYNGVLFGNDSAGLNIMSCDPHQGLYNESKSRWIAYYKRDSDQIGIGTAGLSGEFVTIGGSTSVSGRFTASGGAYISGRYQDSGDDEGLIIGKASNGYAGLTLGGATGVHTTLYLLPDNSTVWRYHNGSSAYDIKHPGKSGTIALLTDVVAATNGPLRVTVTGDDTNGYTADKTQEEIYSAWSSGRYVYVVRGTRVFAPNVILSPTSHFYFINITSTGFSASTIVIKNTGSVTKTDYTHS